MKLLKNQGSERVLDALRPHLAVGGSLDVATADMSVFAVGELLEELRKLSACRLALPAAQITAKSAEPGYPLALGIVTWHQVLKPAGEVTVVFRDSAFVDDVVKTNLTAILEQHGLTNVRSF